MAFKLFKRAAPESGVTEEHTLDENTGEVLSNFNLKPEYGNLQRCYQKFICKGKQNFHLSKFLNIRISSE